jgi:hypothetical protein
MDYRCESAVTTSEKPTKAATGLFSRLCRRRDGRRVRSHVGVFDLDFGPDQIGLARFVGIELERFCTRFWRVRVLDIRGVLDIGYCGDLVRYFFSFSRTLQGGLMSFGGSVLRQGGVLALDSTHTTDSLGLCAFG